MFDVPGRSRLLSAAAEVSETRVQDILTTRAQGSIFGRIDTFSIFVLLVGVLVTDRFPSAERTCAQADLSSVTSPPAGISPGFYDSFNVVVYPVIISPYTPFSFLFTRASAESA